MLESNPVVRNISQIHLRLHKLRCIPIITLHFQHGSHCSTAGFSVSRQRTRPGRCRCQVSWRRKTEMPVESSIVAHTLRLRHPLRRSGDGEAGDGSDYRGSKQPLKRGARPGGGQRPNLCWRMVIGRGRRGRFEHWVCAGWAES